jgi:hypothetical protein
LIDGGRGCALKEGDIELSIKARFNLQETIIINIIISSEIKGKDMCIQPNVVQ